MASLPVSPQSSLLKKVNNNKFTINCHIGALPTVLLSSSEIFDSEYMSGSKPCISYVSGYSKRDPVHSSGAVHSSGSIPHHCIASCVLENDSPDSHFWPSDAKHDEVTRNGKNILNEHLFGDMNEGTAVQKIINSNEVKLHVVGVDYANSESSINEKNSLRDEAIKTQIEQSRFLAGRLVPPGSKLKPKYFVDQGATTTILGAGDGVTEVHTDEVFKEWDKCIPVSVLADNGKTMSGQPFFPYDSNQWKNIFKACVIIYNFDSFTIKICHLLRGKGDVKRDYDIERVIQITNKGSGGAFSSSLVSGGASSSSGSEVYTFDLKDNIVEGDIKLLQNQAVAQCLILMFTKLLDDGSSSPTSKDFKDKLTRGAPDDGNWDKSVDNIFAKIKEAMNITEDDPLLRVKCLAVCLSLAANKHMGDMFCVLVMLCSILVESVVTSGLPISVVKPTLITQDRMLAFASSNLTLFKRNNREKICLPSILAGKPTIGVKVSGGQQFKTRQLVTWIFGNALFQEMANVGIDSKQVKISEITRDILSLEIKIEKLTKKKELIENFTANFENLQNILQENENLLENWKTARYKEIKNVVKIMVVKNVQDIIRNFSEDKSGTLAKNLLVCMRKLKSLIKDFAGYPSLFAPPRTGRRRQQVKAGKVPQKNINEQNRSEAKKLILCVNKNITKILEVFNSEVFNSAILNDEISILKAQISEKEIEIKSLREKEESNNSMDDVSFFSVSGRDFEKRGEDNTSLGLTPISNSAGLSGSSHHGHVFPHQAWRGPSVSSVTAPALHTPLQAYQHPVPHSSSALPPSSSVHASVPTHVAFKSTAAVGGPHALFPAFYSGAAPALYPPYSFVAAPGSSNPGLVVPRRTAWFPTQSNGVSQQIHQPLSYSFAPDSPDAGSSSHSLGGAKKKYRKKTTQKKKKKKKYTRYINKKKRRNKTAKKHKNKSNKKKKKKKNTRQRILKKKNRNKKNKNNKKKNKK